MNRRQFTGTIREWKLVRYHGNDAFILGTVVEHIRSDYFEPDQKIQTSKVKSMVWNKNGTITCLTRNSKYKLID